MKIVMPHLVDSLECEDDDLLLRKLERLNQIGDPGDLRPSERDLYFEIERILKSRHYSEDEINNYGRD